MLQRKTKRQLTYLFLWNFHLDEVTFVVSRVFQRGQLWLTWMYYLMCTCFWEVEISPPESETSMKTDVTPPIHGLLVTCHLCRCVVAHSPQNSVSKTKRLHNGKYLENRMAIIKHCTCKHTGKSQTVSPDRQRESANTFSFQLHFRSRYAAE